jgi:hypothetical protein
MGADHLMGSFAKAKVPSSTVAAITAMPRTKWLLTEDLLVPYSYALARGINVSIMSIKIP